MCDKGMGPNPVFNRESIQISSDDKSAGEKRAIDTSALEVTNTSSCQMQSSLNRHLAREAEAAGAEVSFLHFDERQRQRMQPIATVKMRITMEFGSSIESRLRGLWTDTSFDLQLVMYESACHPVGFTFNK